MRQESPVASFSNVLRIFERGVVVHTFNPGRDRQIEVSSRQPVPCREDFFENSKSRREVHSPPATPPGGLPSPGRPPRITWEPASHGRLATACKQARCEAVRSHEGLGLISNPGCIRAALWFVSGNKATACHRQPGLQRPAPIRKRCLWLLFTHLSGSWWCRVFRVEY